MNIKEYDIHYSKLLRILNPYDKVPYKLDPTMPSTDGKAYKLNPQYRHLYDKLFILQSQVVQSSWFVCKLSTTYSNNKVFLR